MARLTWVFRSGVSFFLAGMLLAVPGPGDQARGDQPNKAEKYALLVGVREYKTPALRSLKYSERDIEDLANVLRDAGFPEANLRILTPARAARGLRYLPSSENIRSELDHMLKQVILGDDRSATVLVAMAGHGIMDPKAEKSFFCPADTSAVNLSPDDPALIDLGALYDQIKASPAGFKLMLVDACRNDPLNPSRAARPIADLVSVTRPFKKRPPGGVAALFSCSEGQVAYEDDDLKHGVFFHFVIEGLKGKADAGGNRDGKVTLGELANYTSTEVYKFVDRTRNDEQRPEYLFKANLINLVDLGVLPLRPFTNSLGMKFVPIKAGQFMMGSADNDEQANDDEKPRHRVRISRPFYLGVHEVTRGHFRRFVDETGYQTEPEKDGKGGAGWNEEARRLEQNPRYTWLNPGFEQTDLHPVVNVSWNDTVAFAEWLSHKEGKTYRLPTEAEWEYACRAGTTTRYFSGNDPERLAEFANVMDGTAKPKFPDRQAIVAHDGFVFTAPVGSYRPNAWGLYDMHGNVWEWCGDLYDESFYKSSRVDDPAGPLQAVNRVIRGGCWHGFPRGSSRSARRWGSGPAYRFNHLGFRLSLDR